MSPVSDKDKGLPSGEARRRPMSATLNRRRPQEGKGTTHFSDQTRRVGGFPLRNWLARKGIVEDAAITKKQEKELRIVFDLFDVDGSGIIEAKHIKDAMHYLDLVSVTDEAIEHSNRTEGLLSFDDFVSRMIKIGFGKKDTLAELYDDRFKSMKSARPEGLMSADLHLMHLQRERQVKVIFSEHKERQAEIYGVQDKGSPKKDSQYASIMDEFMPKQSIYDKAQISAEYVDETIVTHKQTAFKKSLAHLRMKGFGGAQRPSTGSEQIGPMLETIVVMLFQIKNIATVGKNGRCDPWVLIEYNGQSRKTPVMRGTHNPHFNMTVRFPYLGEAADMMMTIFCSEPSHAHESDLVGTCTIKGKTLAEAGQAWHKVDKKKLMVATIKDVPETAEINVATRPEYQKGDFLRRVGACTDEDGGVDGREHDVTAEDAFTTLDAREARNVSALEKLVEWDRGVNRAPQLIEKVNETLARLHVPANVLLYSRVRRGLEFTLRAADVIAKLNTPFPSFFVPDQLEPGIGRSHPPLPKPGVTGTMVRIAIGQQHALGIDECGTVYTWGNRGCSLIVPGGEVGQMSDIEVLEWSNLIKADFRERIRVETHGLSPAAARAVSETLAAERDAYLAKVEDYAADLRTKPNAFTPFAGIQCAEVSCGEGFCAVLSYEGGIFTWGSGSFGKLGHGGLWDEKNPRQVMTLSKRRAILLACGANHVVAVTDNGSLWAWGDGRYGQLGTGALADSGRPTKIHSLEEVGRVTDVACGDNFTAAIVGSRLYTWGQGWFGQLGHRRIAAVAEENKGKGRASKGVGRATRKKSVMGGDERRKSQIQSSLVHHAEMYAGLSSQEMESIEKLDLAKSTLECNMGHEQSERSDDGRARCSPSPAIVSMLEGSIVTLIACGSRHIIAHEQDRSQGRYETWSWGDGAGDKLGHGSYANLYEPQRIESASGVPLVGLACGSTWTAAFSNQQEAFLWGKLDYGDAGRLELVKLNRNLQSKKVASAGSRKGLLAKGGGLGAMFGKH